MIINEIIKGYYSFNSYIFVLEQNISAWMSFDMDKFNVEKEILDTS